MACLVVILWALDCVPTSSVSTLWHGKMHIIVAWIKFLPVSGPFL